MVEPILDSSTQGVSLMELARLSAMMAGAVSGAMVAWLARRNVALGFCSFILGILGGMSVGTGMGRLCFCHGDGTECVVQSGWSALLASGLAGSNCSAPATVPKWPWAPPVVTMTVAWAASSSMVLVPCLGWADAVVAISRRGRSRRRMRYPENGVRLL